MTYWISNRAEQVLRTLSLFRAVRSSVIAFVLYATVQPITALADGPGLPPPPLIKTEDTNRVNVLTGAIQLESPSVSIGPVGQGGLSYDVFGNTQTGDPWISTIKENVDHIYTVTLLGSPESFSEDSGSFSPTVDTGGSLSLSGSTYTYTKADGTVATFNAVSMCDLVYCTKGIINAITYANGQKLTFTMRTTSTAFVIQSINSNLGYQIKIDFVCNTSSMDCYLQPAHVIAINNAIDYCDPAANSCTSFTQSWPTLSISYSATISGITIAVTDAVGNTTSQIRPYDSSLDITIQIQRPSGRQIEYKIFRCTDCDPDTHKQVRDGSSTDPWDYVLDRGTTSTVATITDPLGRVRRVTADSDGKPISEIVDYGGLGLETTYGYGPGPGLPTVITFPEGNSDHYSYDGRGNITGITKDPKPGFSGDITTSATYASSCTSTNFRWCNKPLTITDPNGNVTTYTYSDDHGGVLTETGPAVATGRPQTRYTYQALYAWYKNSSGSLVAAATPVYKLTQVSKCMSGTGSAVLWNTANWNAFNWNGPSCVGTAQETRVTTAYEAGSSSTRSNVLPLSVTTAAGNGSISATTSSTYDIYSNVATKTDPNSNVLAYFYDLNRQQTGTIGPDPDGGGSLGYPAVKTTYDTDARVAEVEQGTTTSQSSMSSFSSLLQKTSAYQVSYFAPISVVTSFVGGTSHPVSATQYSYDQVRNLECTAIREDMSVLGSLPGACTHTTAGGNGPDQIKKNSYDGANRLLTVQRGYDTSSVITEVTNVWTANSKIDYLEDANGNRSDYSYNGQDRLIVLNFPSKTTPHTASTTDYELYGYDANGNRTELTLRSGEYLTFTYDALNRQTEKHFSSSTQPTVYLGYDLVGDMLYAHYSSTSGLGINYTWDALGRKTSETSYGRTVTSQYDTGGNRTHVIWPDSVDIQYTYDPLNRMKQVKNGSTVLAEYSYDDLSRVTGISRSNSATTSMSYSGTSLSWDLSQDLSSTPQDVTFSLGFTPATQVSSRGISNSAYYFSAPSATTRYCSNGLNQYATVGGSGSSCSGGTSFTYDARGNLTSDGSRSFAYDLENRLTGVSGSASMALSYDPKGRLQQTVPTSNTEQYLYDGDSLIAEYNTSGTVLRRYVPGKGVDEFMVWYEGSDLSTPKWLHTDQQGSTVAVSPSSGSATIYAYSPSGEPYGGWGSGGAMPIFRYTGQAALSQIGVYYYKARIYDPVLGRFLQTDPVGYKDEWNLYAYVGNDPVNKTDPAGLMPGDPFDTLEEAGYDAVASSNPTSIRENREYGGFLYFNEGHFYATPAEVGSKDRITSKYVGPAGSLRGIYHDHGDYSKESRSGELVRTNRGQDQRRSDHFSKDDKDNVVDNSKQRKDPNFRGYLGTPSGEVKEFNPETRRERILAPPFAPSSTRLPDPPPTPQIPTDCKPGGSVVCK